MPKTESKKKIEEFIKEPNQATKSEANFLFLQNTLDTINSPTYAPSK